MKLLMRQMMIVSGDIFAVPGSEGLAEDRLGLSHGLD